MYIEKKRNEAIPSPTEYCSAIIDRAEQSPFGKPNFITCIKGGCVHLQEVKRMRTLKYFKRNEIKLFRMTGDHKPGVNHIVVTFY